MYGTLAGWGLGGGLKVLIVTCWAYFLRLKISLIFRDIPVHRLVFVNF